MQIFDKEYKVNPHRLVDDLSKVFKFKGLDDKKVKNQYFLCCPFHSGGNERTASANFSLANRGQTREGDFYCFGCKTRGHISSILVKLFGEKKLAIDWVEGMYGNLRGMVEEKRELRRIEIKDPEPTEKQIFELNKEAYLVETSYFGKRGITDDLVSRFKLGYIDRSKSVYFPVFNRDGEVVFYQTRNIHNKVFYLPKGAKKVLWAANEINGGEVFICESIFNALTLWKFGYQAVAIFGSGDEEIYKQIINLPARSFVVALDPDEAGIRGTKELVKVLRKHNKLVSTVSINEKGKDLNDFAHLQKEEFDHKLFSWLKRGGIGG